MRKEAKLFLVGITIFLLFILALAFIMSGKNSSASASTRRLSYEYLGDQDCIITDTYTGVRYLFIAENNKGYYSSGLTVMLDANGNPLTY